MANIETNPTKFPAALKRRGASAGKIGHNTFVRLEGESWIISYHGNDIVKLSESGNFQAFSMCGWATPTTRDRISQFLSGSPFDVCQRKGEQCVLIRLGNYGDPSWFRKTFPISAYGTITVADLAKFEELAKVAQSESSTKVGA